MIENKIHENVGFAEGASPSETPASDGPSRDNGKYNRSAIKRQALKVSIETRNGKFSRVSSEFIDNIETLIEAKLITLRREVIAFNGKSVDADGAQFLTGEGKAKVIECFNIWIANEIHRVTKDIKVGKTF